MNSCEFGVKMGCDDDPHIVFGLCFQATPVDKPFMWIASATVRSKHPFRILHALFRNSVLRQIVSVSFSQLCLPL